MGDGGRSGCVTVQRARPLQDWQGRTRGRLCGGEGERGEMRGKEGEEGGGLRKGFGQAQAQWEG